MDKTNSNTEWLVRETSINIAKSLLGIARGSVVRVAAPDFARLNSVRSAATRANQRAGFKEFEVSTPDNGATLVIQRHVRH